MWLRQNEDSVTMITKLHMASVAVSKDWSLDSSATIYVAHEIQMHSMGEHTNTCSTLCRFSLLEIRANL